MGDEVCIWGKAEVLTKRCHFPCFIINLPIPSADAYQQLMWEVFCDQYWERVGIHEFHRSLTGEFRQVCIPDRMANVMIDIPV